MRFRGAMTFNTQDTGFSLDERIVIHPGVEYRCELVLTHVLKHRKGIGAEQLTEEINADKNCLYSVGDVRYALGRLTKEGLLYRASRDTWKGTSRAMSVWERMKRETV